MAFKNQIYLTIKLKKPIVLHIRGPNTEEVAIKILKDSGLPSNWPIHRHCWNGSVIECQEWISNFKNSVIGFTPLITYDTARNVQQVAKIIPLEKIILETDAPYFAPKDGGRKSGRNYSLPIDVDIVAKSIAKIRGCTSKEVLLVSRENIKKIYDV